MLFLTVEMSERLPAGVAGIYEALEDGRGGLLVLPAGLAGSTVAVVVGMLLGWAWEARNAPAKD